MPSLYLSGACLYQATPYQTGPARVAALVDLLGSIPKQHAAGEAQLQVRRKRLDDIRLELERPFKHEGRLLDLMTRQRELLKRLDLDKGHAEQVLASVGALVWAGLQGANHSHSPAMARICNAADRPKQG